MYMDIYIYVFNQLIMTSYWDISIPYDDWMVFSVFSFYSVFFGQKDNHGESWGCLMGDIQKSTLWSHWSTFT